MEKQNQNMEKTEKMAKKNLELKDLKKLKD